MNSKKFINMFFISMGIIFLFIAGINFIIDPGEIYLKKLIHDEKLSEFSDKLMSSEYGVVEENWNERLIKASLITKISEDECIALGSSHILSMSTIRNVGNLSIACPRFLNLGVSGASIEDIAIYSYMILNNNILPKKVFINIDPWTLKFDMDNRYLIYVDFYDKMNNFINFNTEKRNHTSYHFKILANLINIQYFKASINEIMNFNQNIQVEIQRDNLFNQAIEYPSKDFNYTLGGTKIVMLKDGSRVYTSSWLNAHKNNVIPYGGGELYKTDGVYYNENTVDYLKKIVNLYVSKGINVSFMLTPYHPNVFKIVNDKQELNFDTGTTARYIGMVNKRVIALAKELNINIIGSYYPDELGCKEDEFFDFMHVNRSCLDRINFISKNSKGKA